jgi:hypothetical protein
MTNNDKVVQLSSGKVANKVVGFPCNSVDAWHEGRPLARTARWWSKGATLTLGAHRWWNTMTDGEDVLDGRRGVGGDRARSDAVP